MPAHGVVAYRVSGGSPLAATSSRLRGEGSGRCLGTDNASTASGAGGLIWDCQTAANQWWTTWGGGEIRVFGDKCLQGATSGARVTIASCTGQNNQRWALNANATVTNTGSGLCLDVNQAGAVNGSTVILWTCNGQANQRWTRV